jgi:hypothetical protein
MRPDEALLSQVNARIQIPENHENMDALVAALIAWIVAKTGLTAPDPPRIVQIPIEQMVEMTGSTARPQAIYVRKERTIYLPTDWTGDTLLNRAALLHELVHHLQETNGVQAPCERAQEVDAYHLELDWLRERGVDDPYEFLGINELAIMLRSTCLD